MNAPVAGSPALDAATVTASVERVWDEALGPLCDYIRIPAKSPAFDAAWEANGHLDAAVELLASWCGDRLPTGATLDVVRLPGRTPVVLIDVPASPGIDDPDTVLLYGHLDKQPEMTGWDEGFGPWTPVIVDDRLYGRGGADDGYSAFAVIAALTALDDAGGGHARCVALIEASEESGSPDLPAYLDLLADRLGQVGLVVCLDSYAGDYERLWATNSLRGLLQVELRADVLTRGSHSGMAGGLVASSFRVLRRLLDRIEDAETGRILLDALWAEVPEHRRAELARVAAAGIDPRDDLSFAPGAAPIVADALAAWLATTWEPTMATIGADGIPHGEAAGNVLRPFTALDLSFRLPPTVDARAAGEAVVAALTDPPAHDAAVRCRVREAESGWDAAPTAPWLSAALDQASVAHFGQPSGALGLGGSIPFMTMLGRRYPAAQFVITGALGPGSNAHGPNEFLHLPTARRVSACVAQVLEAHTTRTGGDAT